MPAVPAVRILHDRVPGRVRVAMPCLAYDPKAVEAVVGRLARSPGILRASGNSRTATLLVHFDRTLAVEDVVERVRTARHGTPPSPSAEPRYGANPPVASAAAGAPAWHALSAEAALAALDSPAGSGLGDAEARTRLGRHGPNLLAAPRARRDAEIMLEQFKGLPAVFLMGSAALSVLTGGLLDAAAIAVVTAVNSGIGFATEREAERTIAALGQRAPRRARVRRDGVPREISAAEVVPGDHLLLQQGNLVAADGRLIEVADLAVDESLLTGESLPVEKHSMPLVDPALPLGERRNMVFKETAVTGGGGHAVVVATGGRTEIGRIQALTAGARPPRTPLERQLDRMSRRIALASGGVFVAMIGAGMLHGLGLLPMLKSAVSLGVAALPEGLPTVATVTLALGIREMRRQMAVVRRLNAVETLGGVTILCFDKTGTLTQNRMAVAAVAGEGEPVWLAGTPARLAEMMDPALLDRLLEVAVLCNESRESTGGPDAPGAAGSATEIALVEFARSQGAEAAPRPAEWPCLSTRLRTRSRLYMETWHGHRDGRLLRAVKGSPEQVLALCGARMADGGERPMTDADRAAILAQNRTLASRGLRVLGFARSETPARGDISASPLSWLGLAGLADPLRPGLRETIRRFHEAGIRTVMITGDQTATAYALARELDLAGGDAVEVVEGPQLAATDPALLSALARRAHIFARVSPEHKLQIVEALQRAGEVVAMTGDGINDSPALRRADIGVAMGSGADSAHEVADLILEDDRLETVALAVARGRTIYANVQRSVRFMLATNLSEVAVMLGGTVLGLGTPLTPLQLLWVNLVTDVLPGLALGLEPAADDVLQRPPRDPGTEILDPQMRRQILREAAILSGWILTSHVAGRLVGGPAAASGWALTTLTVGQLLHAVSSRSEHAAWSWRDRPPNHKLTAAVGGLIATQFAVSFVPGLRGLLGLGALGPAQLAAAGALAVASFGTQEVVKALAARPGRPSGGIIRLTRATPKEGEA